MPFEIVAALERFVVECFDKESEALGIFTWWVLILIFASLRWDDGRHVSPQSLEFNDDALLGMVWQTKVDRKRRGLKFCVVRALEISVKKGHLEPAKGDDLSKGVHSISWHSRVTLLDAAVKNQVDTKIIGLQANWRDPGPMVLKYARQRKDLSVAMVKKLANALRETWTPDADRFEADDDPDVVEPSVAEYVLKDNVSEKALASLDVKFHIINRAINSEFSLCGKIPLGETLCKLCETAQNRANGS